MICCPGLMAGITTNRFPATATFELPVSHLPRSLCSFVTALRKLIAIVLVLLMQGPAMLVQEVAWVSMLVTYTQERGLKRGVMETFDGEHPCELCNKAAQIHQQEQAPEPGEKPMPQRGQRLAWAEMVVSEMLHMPAIAGKEVSVSWIALTTRDAGKDADAPDSPPPEWA